MTSRRSDDAAPAAEPLDEVGRDDWNRYGLSHQVGTAAAAPTDAIGRPMPQADRKDDQDDMFLAYQHENGGGVGRLPRSKRSPRFMANVATASVVGGLGLVVMVAALVTSVVMPSPSPTPSRTPFQAAANSASPGASAALTSRTAHIGLVIDLPSPITIPDRDQTPDDGTLMYLTGPSGGIAMDPGTGAIKTIYGGAAFFYGMRRAAILDGLWVSSWPADAAPCGPSCWPAADTYRIDPSTGNVTKALPATYLVGAASEGIWVATADKLQLLDPTTGALLSTTSWKGSAEPRVGCGYLWSYTPSDKGKGATLSKIDPRTGGTIGTSILPVGVTYGPTYIEGLCWMMTGSGGASTGSTKLVWLTTDGTTQAVLDYPGRSIVTLDREFWLYSSGGTMQRFEATAGVSFGVPYLLQAQPADNDPKWLFAAAGTLWMIRGSTLAGFDLPTGTSRVNG